jgi:hypothetical protein
VANRIIDFYPFGIEVFYFKEMVLWRMVGGAYSKIVFYKRG